MTFQKQKKDNVDTISNFEKRLIFMYRTINPKDQEDIFDFLEFKFKRHEARKNIIKFKKIR